MERQSRLEMLPKLKLFELTVIAKYLSTYDKLCVMHKVSRAWHALVRKPYAWASMPENLHLLAPSEFSQFMFLFDHLEGISLPRLPPSFLISPQLIHHLASADSIGFERIT